MPQDRLLGHRIKPDRVSEDLFTHQCLPFCAAILLWMCFQSVGFKATLSTFAKRYVGRSLGRLVVDTVATLPLIRIAFILEGRDMVIEVVEDLTESKPNRLLC